ncbi:hypothetical protein [Acetobacter sp.]|uniref:hypothetical protein n=1 Tax=Acetobacter sp. TaxID=440 RepID=UPI0039E9E303
MMPGRSENFAPPVATPPRCAPFRTRNTSAGSYTADLQSAGERLTQYHAILPFSDFPPA